MRGNYYFLCFAPFPVPPLKNEKKFIIGALEYSICSEVTKVSAPLKGSKS